MALTLIVMDRSEGEREWEIEVKERETHQMRRVQHTVHVLPGVRVGLTAPLSCCSAIAPHSHRLREMNDPWQPVAGKNWSFLKQSRAIQTSQALLCRKNTGSITAEIIAKSAWHSLNKTWALFVCSQCWYVATVGGCLDVAMVLWVVSRTLQREFLEGF